MGRRRRKTIRIVRRRLPKFFKCPVCEKISISVAMKNDKHAVVACALCSLREKIKVGAPLKPIDIYCRFIDEFYESST